jgi:nicotinate-nucleotide adenylyltransferase
MLEELPAWHRAEEVLSSARVVVALRPPWDERLEGVLARLRKSLPAEQVEELASSVVAAPRVEISSSEVRRRVAAGRSIRFLVPEKVRAYIASEGLYGASAGGPPGSGGEKMPQNRP